MNGLPAGRCGPFEEWKTARMNYFSRLTDIVTCNLNEMLAREADPAAALRKIITEMEAGLAGARRSVATAAANGERLGKEVAELDQQTDQLTEEARAACGRPTNRRPAWPCSASRRWPTSSPGFNNSSKRPTRLVNT